LYKSIVKAIQKQRRTFLSTLEVKVSIRECSLDNKEKLLFQRRCWVLKSEPLCTGLIQQTYNSVIAGHSEREATTALIIRQFF
jgi:hypothetical protein